MYQYNEVVVHVYSSSLLVNRGSSICVKQSCTSKTRKYNRCIVALYQYTEVVVQMYRRTVLVYRGSSTKYMCTVALYLYTEVQYMCTEDLYQYTKVVVQVYTRYVLVHRFTEIVVHVFSIHICTSTPRQQYRCTVDIVTQHYPEDQPEVAGAG